MESGNGNRALVSGGGGSVPEQSSGDAIGARCTFWGGRGASECAATSEDGYSVSGRCVRGCLVAC
jgi:hypothetical protein